jgi:hypothetical protein
MKERLFRERRAESEAEDGVFALLGLPRGDKFLTAQITLPHRHGGLGLSHIAPPKASLHTSPPPPPRTAVHCAMHSGPEAFWPFHGPSGNVLHPQWEDLHEGTGPLQRLEFREVGPDSMGIIATTTSTIYLHSA